MEIKQSICERATEMASRVVDFDYLEGSLIVETKSGNVLLAESKGGKYVYGGLWFPMCNCSEFWQALTEILLGIRKPSRLIPFDIHEQAHDDW